MQYSTSQLCDYFADSVDVVEPIFHDYGGKHSFCGIITTIKCFENIGLISDILSEYNVVLFGSYIDLYFNQSDWNFGSFMALIMLMLIGISVFLTRKFSKDETGGRTSLW